MGIFSNLGKLFGTKQTVTQTSTNKSDVAVDIGITNQIETDAIAKALSVFASIFKSTEASNQQARADLASLIEDSNTETLKLAELQTVASLTVAGEEEERTEILKKVIEVATKFSKIAGIVLLIGGLVWIKKRKNKK